MSIQPRGGRKQGDFFYLSTMFIAANGTAYFPVMGNSLTTSATETEADLTADFGFLVRRLRTIVTNNSATGNSVISFRRNAATPTGASLTYTTTAIGESATAILSQNIAAGDLIDIELNVTDGATNDIRGIAYLICQRVTD